MPRPQCFISYSWDDHDHTQWVAALADRLSDEGIDVVLDRSDGLPGDQLPQFMESSIRDSTFVLAICTPLYKDKADHRIGGVGYESNIMTAEDLVGRARKKIVPVLRIGAWEDSAPSFCLGRYYVDLSGDPYSEAPYRDLVDHLLGTHKYGPPPGGVRTEARPSAAGSTQMWHRLEAGALYTLSDSRGAQAVAVGTLRDSLISTFRSQAAQFTLLLASNPIIGGSGEQAHVYTIWAPHRELIWDAEKSHTRWLQEMLRVRLESTDPEADKVDLRRRMAQHQDSIADWSVQADMRFDSFPRAHEVTYDPELRRIRIVADQRLRTDPAQYDRHVGTTSEALLYASAVAGQPFVNVGDLGWMADSPELLRLTTYVLDRRKLDLERFRVYDRDPELWDFSFPELHAETLGRS